jgi:hypothetical protein
MLIAVLFAALAISSTAKVYADPIDNAMLLDPYDPVPQIQFHHGCDWGCRGCIDSCGWRHCWNGCYASYHHCWRGCWRGRPWRCEFGCGPSLGEIFEQRIQRYDYQADRNDALVHQYEDMAHHYEEQACWYDWHVRGRVCDHHDGPVVIDHHDGFDADHHDGGPIVVVHHDGPDGPPPDFHDGPH